MRLLSMKFNLKLSNKNNFKVQIKQEKPTTSIQLEYRFYQFAAWIWKISKNPFALSTLKHKLVTSQRSHQSQKPDRTSAVHSEQLWKNKLGQCPFLWYPNLKINQKKLWVRQERWSSCGQIITKNEGTLTIFCKFIFTILLIFSGI